MGKKIKLRKKRIMKTLITILILLISTPVYAGDWYIGVGSGYSSLSDSTSTGSVSFNDGYSTFGSIGYDFGNFKTEFETSYRSNPIDTINGIGVDGSTDSIAYMGNAIYDIPLTTMNFQPYIGAGLGYADIKADVSVLGTRLIDDSSGVFAYQFMGGINYGMTDKTEVFTGYRYFDTMNPKFQGIEADYASHGAEIGFRYRY